MKFILRTPVVFFVLLAVSMSAHTSAFAKTDYESLRRFSQILDLVEQHYVSESGQQDLIDGAIKGMLESLDPHSTYMNPEEFALMYETTSGEFFGIGAELTMEKGQLIVIAPIEDTPAFRAGIKSGDIIISVDGKLTLDRSLTETVANIRGKKGTEVELVILPKNETKTKTITLKRDKIPYISVKSKEIEPGYEWVRLIFFNERTTTELEEALKKAQAKKPLKGIILDLRNNPGGILNEAASVSDLFLDKGTIVTIKGRGDDVKRRFSALPRSGDILDVPLVVLINSGSASASEIVAGALSDNKRALLVGETSFGKGSVQNLIPLSDGSGIKLTIALYYTPNGKSIQAEGIIPNIEVSYAPKVEGEEEGFVIREKDLDKHLDRGKSDVRSEKEDELVGEVKQIPAPALTELPANITEENREILERDNQLRTALQVLKDMPDLNNL